MRNRQNWDAPGILAEIKRRGETLTGLARKGGISEAGCRTSLTRPFPAADKIISDFLGVPLQELWPDRYDRDGARIDKRTIHFRAQNKRKAQSAHRLNGEAA